MRQKRTEFVLRYQRQSNRWPGLSQKLKPIISSLFWTKGRTRFSAFNPPPLILFAIAYHRIIPLFMDATGAACTVDFNKYDYNNSLTTCQSFMLCLRHIFSGWYLQSYRRFYIHGFIYIYIYDACIYACFVLRFEWLDSVCNSNKRALQLRSMSEHCCSAVFTIIISTHAAGINANQVQPNIPVAAEFVYGCDIAVYKTIAIA